MDSKIYVKLSNLVDSHFKVESVGEFVFKKWDAQSNKMLFSQSYEPGYRKIYPITTDKGILDLGAGQLGNLFEATQYGGKADLIGQTFNVKSNGKTGIDIRYYFNPVKSAEPKLELDEPIPDFPGDY